jgi:hypothetical protein
MRYNKLLVGALTLVLLVGQSLVLPAFWRLGLADTALVAFAIFLVTGTASTLGALLTGMAAGCRLRPLAVLLWSVVLAIGTAFFWDNFSYGWLGLHLQDSLPLLFWNVLAGRGMQTKLLALALVLVAYCALAPAVVVAANRLCRRFPWLEVRKDFNWLAILGAAGAGIVCADESAARYTMSPAGYRLRADRVWISNLLRLNPPPPAPGSLVIERPAFWQLPDEREVQDALDQLNPSMVRRPLSVS